MKLLARWRTRRKALDEGDVYVSERYGVRSLHIGSDTVQSSMRVSRPNDLELSYTRSMMAFLLFVPEPREILMIGLGGGSLAKFVVQHLAHTRTRVVEVNPRVVTVARQAFFVPDDSPTFEIITADGAAYVQREDVAADVIFVDGYEADAYVEELANPVFYDTCRQRLKPNGVMVVNLWGGDKQFHRLVKAIEDAFPGGTLCLPAERPGNVIVFGFERKPGPVKWKDLARKAEALEAGHGLEYTRFVESFKKMNPHDAERLYP
jgi:spermidine synthase